MKLRSLLAASAAAMLSLVAMSPVLAQEGTARVRVAHFSPDAPAVDVYISEKKMLTNVIYEKHSAYLEVPAKAGTVIEVRANGSAADSAPAIKVVADLAAGKSYTVAAIGKLASITGKVYEDDVTAPPAGKVKLRVIHAAPDVKPVDIAVKGGAELATKLAFPDATPYLTLAPGTYAVEVRESGSTTAIVSNDVILLPGGVYTVVAIGGADKQPKLKGLIDLPAKNAAATSIAAPAAATTIVEGSATTIAAVEPSAPETTAAIAAVPDTTLAAATTVAETSVPETTAVEATAESSVAPESTPDSTVATEPEPTTIAAPAGGVASGAGGLAGGGAFGVTALLGASASVLAFAAYRRRSARA